MTWVRFDDHAPEHPKIAGLSDGAFRLWFDAMCYCNRALTDGAIPTAILGRLRRKADRAAAELVAAGLWRVTDGGWQVHDYTEFQPKRSEVMAKRQRNAIAGAKGAASRWHDRQNSPDPDPDPDPEIRPDPGPVPIASAAIFRLFRDTFGKPPRRNLEADLVHAETTHPPACIEWVFRVTAGLERPNWNYAAAMLVACDSEGHGPRERRNGYALTRKPADDGLYPASEGWQS